MGVIYYKNPIETTKLNSLMNVYMNQSIKSIFSLLACVLGENVVTKLRGVSLG